MKVQKRANLDGENYGFVILKLSDLSEGKFELSIDAIFEHKLKTPKDVNGKEIFFDRLYIGENPNYQTLLPSDEGKFRLMQVNEQVRAKIYQFIKKPKSQTEFSLKKISSCDYPANLQGKCSANFIFSPTFDHFIKVTIDGLLIMRVPQKI